MKLFVIGNGFDKAHKLKTDYTDFRNYLEDVDPEFLINLEYMYGIYPETDSSYYRKMLWSEFEKNLSNIMETEFAEAGKKVSAICAAPLVLGGLGVLEGKKATIYPGMEEHLAGAQPAQGRVVKDENIITSQGPGTAMDFALAIVEEFCGAQVAEDLRKDLILK